MGFEFDLFINKDIDPELICSICLEVFDNPTQIMKCEHVFCSSCIKNWIKENKTCPHERNYVDLNELKAGPRILKNILDRLQVKCIYNSHGCNDVMNLDSLLTHSKNCNYDPNKPKLCKKGCGIEIQSNLFDNHNCFKSLSDLIHDLKLKLDQQDKEINEMRQREEILKNQIKSLGSPMKDLLDKHWEIEHTVLNKLESLSYKQTKFEGEIQDLKIKLSIDKSKTQPIINNNLSLLHPVLNERKIDLGPKTCKIDGTTWIPHLKFTKLYFIKKTDVMTHPSYHDINKIKTELKRIQCPESTINQLIKNNWPKEIANLFSLSYWDAMKFQMAISEYNARKLPSLPVLVILSTDNSTKNVPETGFIMCFETEDCFHEPKKRQNKYY